MFWLVAMGFTYIIISTRAFLKCSLSFLGCLNVSISSFFWLESRGFRRTGCFLGLFGSPKKKGLKKKSFHCEECCKLWQLKPNQIEKSLKNHMPQLNSLSGKFFAQKLQEISINCLQNNLDTSYKVLCYCYVSRLTSPLIYKKIELKR